MGDNENQMFKEKKTKIDWKETWVNFSNEHPGAFAIFVLALLICFATGMWFIVEFLIDHPEYLKYILCVAIVAAITYVGISFKKSIKRKNV